MLKTTLQRYADAWVALFMTAFLSILMIQMEFFEWWFDFTRKYEKWELDEVIVIVFAAMFAGTIVAIRRNAFLTHILEDLAESQAKLKVYESERNKREKMAALGALSSGISHEINNSLQPILGLSELIEMRADAKDEITQECAETIKKNALHMRSIMQQVMQVSRSEDADDTPYIVSDLMEDVVMFTGGLLPKTVEYKLSYTTSAKSKITQRQVLINRTSVVQVLTNLMTNAAHAMDNQGEVDIEVDYVYVGPAEAIKHSIRSGDYACVYVSDNGCGMEEGEVQKMFEPFYTSKPEGEGTGLGLSVSYGLVRKWGGDIFAESEKGKGTTVSFYIPIQLEEIKG